MNNQEKKQLAWEYTQLSMAPDIELRISEALALVIIIQMQKAYRISNAVDREVMEYLVDFCKELIESTSASSRLKELINCGWESPIDFNNPTTPPDELN